MERTHSEEQLGITRELVNRQPWLIAGIVLLSVVSTLGTLALPLTAARLISAMQRGGSTLVPVLLMVGAGLAAAAAHALSTYLLSRVGEQMVGRVRSRFMAHSLRLPLSVVRREGQGTLAARLGTDGLQMKAVVDVGVLQLPMAIITVTGTAVIMALLDWVLLLYLVASFALSVGGVVVIIKVMRKRFMALQMSVAKMTQVFMNALEALPTIKAYRAEQRTSRELAALAQDTADLGVTTTRLASLLFPVINLGQQIALVTVIVAGGVRLNSGLLTLPDLAAFLLYMLQLTAPLLLVAMGVGSLQAGLASRDRFRAIFATPTEESADAAAPAPRTAPSEETPAAAVRFEGVTFSYESQPALRAVDFTIPRRGMTALVGMSGAGKTTVLSLIERFISADSGTVRVLGEDVTRWRVADLRAHMAYVDQKFTLLSDTIRANLTLGTSSPPPDDRLMAALAEVGMEEAVRALPGGLDARLDEGTDISGGQRQRLALARAILAEGELVLLDEPSSQLDSVNEMLLRDSIRRMADDRALLVVAHRLSTVQDADHIIVLDRGQVVADGTHHELMARSPEYSLLVRGQLLSSV